MHKFKKLKIVVLIVLIFSACFGVLFSLSTSAKAEDGGEDLETRVLFNTLRLCYTQDKLTKGLSNGSSDSFSYQNFYDVVGYDRDYKLMYENQPVALGITGHVPEKTNDSNYKDYPECGRLFSNLLYTKRHTVPPAIWKTSVLEKQQGAYGQWEDTWVTHVSGSTPDDIEDFLLLLGYDDTGNDNRDTRRYTCIKVSYKRKRDDNAYELYQGLASVCWDDSSIFDSTQRLDADPLVQGMYSIVPDKVTVTSMGTIRIPHGVNDGNNETAFTIEVQGLGSLNDYNERIIANIAYDAASREIKFTSCENRSDESEPLDPNKGCNEGQYFAGEVTYLMFEQIVDNRQEVLNLGFTPSKFFAITSASEAYLKARGYLDSKYADDNRMYLPYTWQEIYDLYIHYLSDYYNASVDKNDCSTAGSEDRVYTSIGWCKYLTAGAHLEEKVDVFPHDTGNVNDNTVLNQQVDAKGLVKKLYNLASNTQVEGTDVDDFGHFVDPLPSLASGRSNILSDQCLKSSGALGWIFCSIIKFAHNTMDDLYGSIVKNYLNIDTVLLKSADARNPNDLGSGTYQAWSVFVGFGNIIMIAFLVVIIFSQLTGVGIDNYGIKKALPKIIIAAVLINASFIISQALADLSNIIGNALEGMLTSIGDGLTRTASIKGSYASGAAFQDILNVLLMAGGASVIATGYSAVVSGGPMGLIFPLAIGLLIALLAILFFFTLLGIRKAAIVMLVVVSPIAFACYMLPNMKTQVFDRWLKMFKAMLLAYPICGFVLGGSNLASGILMSTGMDENFLFYFINLLLMVVPFFFLPSLIKKSMSVLGGIMDKASGVMRGYARSGNDRLKNWNQNRPANQQRQALHRENIDRRHAERVRERLADRKKLSAAQTARLAAANEILAKQAETDASRNTRADSKWLAGAIGKGYVAADTEALQTGNFGDERYVKGTSEKNRLENRKDLMNTRHFANKKFAEGQQFLNDTESFDKAQRTKRYNAANVDARVALKNKLKIKRDEERRDDNLYATRLAHDAAIQSNISKIISQRAKNEATMLSAGRMVVNGRVVHQNNHDSLRDAQRDLLNTLSTVAAGSDAYNTTMAQLKAVQDVMMRSDRGRTNLVESYEAIASTGTISNNVKMAASNFNATYEEKLKSVNPAGYKMMQDIADTKVSSASIKADLDDFKYMVAGLDEMTPATLKDCDTKYLENICGHLNAAWATGSITADDARAIVRLQALRNKYMDPANLTNQKAETTNILKGLVF